MAAAHALPWLHSLAPLPGSGPLTVAAGEVHIFYVFAHDLDIDDAEQTARYEAMLTADELDRYRRFVMAKTRHEHLLTRALVRSVLSRYAAVAPAEWRFDAGPHGKPFICQPELGWPLSFNLSNTDGLIACAVSWGADVGIDVEDAARSVECQVIASSYFAPVEARALLALPGARQRERFFVYWTLKESYIKARGLGLAIPLEHFWFSLGSPSQGNGGSAGAAAAPLGADITIAFDPRLEDDPASWAFALLRASARHLMAVSVRRTEPATPIAWYAQHHVPLAGP